MYKKLNYLIKQISLLEFFYDWLVSGFRYAVIRKHHDIFGKDISKKCTLADNIRPLSIVF